MNDNPFVDVVLNRPIRESFTYRIANVLDTCHPGQRVHVDFNNALETAFVIAVNVTPPADITIKPITAIIDKEPILTQEQLALGRWMADTFFSSFGEALFKIAPATVHPTTRNTPLEKGSELYDYVRTTHQNNIINSIIASLPEGGEHLLHGVTSSGKTEVYMSIMEEVLRGEKNALLLIPEISLTPQTIRRFSSRFSVDRMAVIHSRLTPRQKMREWMRILNGNVQLVIGPRSAIFAPLDNIGLIVIDEEHDPSYKEHSSPRYDARLVARYRADIHNACLVYGTATPSLSVMYRARCGKVRLHELPERVTPHPLPAVALIDLRAEQVEFGVFSTLLLRRIETTLKNNEQTILFLNRRGYSNFMLCHSCGTVIECPHCAVSLTYHLYEQYPILRCHYCGYSQAAPEQCPKCQSSAIGKVGAGTQQVEELVHLKFPDARIARLDADTTRKKGALEKVLHQFGDNNIDILIGTQMVTKGLDFPNVTLIGILLADTSLKMPDFSAPERTFDLITQVAGRSGRGKKPGMVLIQTYNPDHYSIQCALKHDYTAFYEKEIMQRAALQYPPYRHLIKLTVRGEQEDAVKEEALRLSNHLETLRRIQGVAVKGPIEAFFYKLKKHYRRQMLLFFDDKAAPDIKKALLSFHAEKRTYLEIDVAPVDTF